MIGQAVGSGIRAIGDARAAKRRGEFFGDLREQGEEQARQAKKARDSYGLGSTYRRFLNMSMQDPIADLRRQQEERRQASNLGALQSGGARALIGGLQAQAQGASDRMNKISADEAARRASAFQVVGQAEQNVLRNKATFANRDLLDARALAGAGLQGQFNAEQARRAAGNQFLGDFTSALGQAAEGGLFGEGDNKTKDLLRNSNMLFPTGKKGMKTPGEFSHATNPINMMQKGAKIGELTGGEYVINPEQAEKIAQQSKFAKMLFRKFDKEVS